MDLLDKHMNLFDKHMDLIESVAARISILFKGKYEISELINEAYLKYNIAITNNPSLVEGKFSNIGIFLNRVKHDIKDFIREDTKFRKKQRWEEQGYIFPTFATTSFQREDEDGPVLHEPSTNNENDVRKEFLDELFTKVELSDTEWAIIQGYFYSNKTMKEVGLEIGYAESTISNKNKKMCEKLLACANTLV